MKLVRCLIAVLLGSVSVAQAAVSVTVTPDKVVIDTVTGEFVPRFATYLPNSLTVPVGATVTLTADATHDAIEVAGTLKCDRVANYTVRFIHLTILPGGLLDCGTVADPVRGNVTFVVRNVPIDTAKDPWQFGNGLINFGRRQLVGVKTTHVVGVVGDLAKGALTFTASEVPVNWKIGDELLIPDFRQIHETTPLRREAKLTIAAISGSTVTFSKPLDFEHNAIRDPDGGLAKGGQMRVANLTRSFVIKSENPLSVRGHMADIGHGATWDVRYISQLGLGRTRNVLLHNTKVVSGAVTQVGTNQVGRYSDHHHHAHGHNSACVGNVLDGLAPNAPASLAYVRWGFAVHGTHDSLHEENVAINFIGAGGVTEDGYEVRNVFRRNIAAYIPGNGVGAVGNVIPGGDGSGFWFHGLKNIIDDNEAWDSHAGINLFQMDQLNGMVPSTPGGPHDTLLTSSIAMPISVNGNRLHSNVAGLETWGNREELIVSNVYASNNQDANVLLGNGQPGRITITNLFAYCQSNGLSGRGVFSSSAYHSDVSVDGGEIRGCSVGTLETMFLTSIKNVLLQNATNIDLLAFMPVQTILASNTYKPLGANPARHIILRDQPALTPIPARFAYWYNTGTRVRVTNWQGTGQDFLLFPNASKRTSLAWHSTAPFGIYQVPESGKTSGEMWDKYGLAYGGGVVGSEAVALEGLIGGVAKPGSTYTLGPPRTVMTFPVKGTSAVVTNGTTKLVFLLTGNTTQASETMVWKIDGGARQSMSTVPWAASYGQEFDTPIVTPGQHDVVTWREDKVTLQPISGSELNFTYTIGPIGPPVQEELCGAIPPIDDDGDGDIDENCPPVPVNCVVSEFVWGACVNGSQTGTRTITTQPTNGGTACPALTETRTCTAPPPTFDWRAFVVALRADLAKTLALIDAALAAHP